MTYQKYDNRADRFAICASRSSMLILPSTQQSAIVGASVCRSGLRLFPFRYNGQGRELNRKAHWRQPSDMRMTPALRGLENGKWVKMTNQ